MGHKKKAGRGDEPSALDRSPVRARELALAVAVVVLCARAGELRVLLVREGADQDADRWALPGGLVGAEEPLEAAAQRELRAETGLALDLSHIEQLRTYGAPDRDDRPDRRVVTVAYFAIQSDPVEPEAGTDAEPARWVAAGPILAGSVPLAFDHAAIVRDAVERLRHDLEHTAVATAFFKEAFTEAQLRSVYEAVWGAGGDAGKYGLDAPNFHRTIATMSPPMVERVPDQRAATGGRPAALYRPSDYVREGGPAARLERPILRPKDGVVKRKVH